MLNKVILIGNLGRNPEIKNFENGTAVCSFSIATNENYKDKSGEWQTNTEWHNISIWGDAAERCNKSLEKGDRVLVEGKLSTRQWTKEGEESARYQTVIRARYVKKISDQKSATEQGESEAAKLASENGRKDDEAFEEMDSLPF
jgi:single-strand DNA-binding protein